MYGCMEYFPVCIIFPGLHQRRPLFGGRAMYSILPGASLPARAVAGTAPAPRRQSEAGHSSGGYFPLASSPLFGSARQTNALST